MNKTMVLVFHSSFTNNTEDKIESIQVPEGQYDVQLKKIDLRETATRQPVLVMSYEITEGLYQGHTVAQEQLLDTGARIAQAYDLIRQLESGLEIVFKDYVQFAGLLKEVEKVVTDEARTFQVAYTEKGCLVA